MEFLEPSAKKSAPPEGLVPQYPQRAPLKRAALPGLVAKALAVLEAAPDLAAADALPEALRAQHGFMPWHQARMLALREAQKILSCMCCRGWLWLSAPHHDGALHHCAGGAGAASAIRRS